MCLADFAPGYVRKKTGDVPIEPDEIKSYTVSVSNIDAVKLNPNIIVLKNKVGEMNNLSQSCVVVVVVVFFFKKVSKLKSPEEDYLILLQ